MKLETGLYVVATFIGFGVIGLLFYLSTLQSSAVSDPVNFVTKVRHWLDPQWDVSAKKVDDQLIRQVVCEVRGLYRTEFGTCAFTTKISKAEGVDSRVVVTHFNVKVNSLDPDDMKLGVIIFDKSGRIVDGDMKTIIYQDRVGHVERENIRRLAKEFYAAVANAYRGK